MQNIYLKILISVIAVSVVGAAGYLFYLYSTKNQSAGSINPYVSLMNSNPAFSTGEQLFDQDNPAEAAKAYQRALLLAENKAEEAQIKNKIAAAIESAGDVTGAIALSKEVAANEAYPRIARAYAVQFMGQIFNAHPASDRGAITGTIFNDEPYKGLASTTDDAVSYRNLFDYASSLYPLGISELRVAYWYAVSIFKIKDKASLSQGDKEQVEEYLRIISDRVSLADADIARVREVENESIILPATYIRKVLVNMRLIEAKEAYTGMGTPEGIYDEALQYVRQEGRVDDEATLQFSYATYLGLQYGSVQKSEIRGLLDDFYDSERFATTSVMKLFAVGETRSPAADAYIRLLVGIDSEFKAFLQAKGWKFS